ncbi:MAG: hypothetical protein WBM83_09155 [Flavobacteriaceae bacterium]
MANQPKQDASSTEEIDLGQLFQLFKKALNRIFRGILRLFLYLKKHALIFIGLIILGLAIGYMLNLMVDKKLKSEVIVMPNFESKDYLYDTVEEIQSNIISGDTLFFKNMDIDVNELRAFEINIEPIEEEEQVDKDTAKENNDYLTVLQNFKDNDFVVDVFKSEILKKTVLTHRITFSHKNPVKGEAHVTKMLNYINKNPYFTALRDVSVKNAKLRIEKNTELIKQIDDLVMNYSSQLTQGRTVSGAEGAVLFDNEKSLDVPSLLNLKNKLVREIEEKEIDLLEQKDAISIINLGRTQVVKKQFLNKSLFMIPAILVGLFFAWTLLVYLNNKSKQLY